MLGIGAAGMAVRPIMRPMPLPIDMSKGQVVEQASEPEPESREEREWTHPCADKTDGDTECKSCPWYFCPLADYTITDRCTRPTEYRMFHPPHPDHRNTESEDERT